MLVMHICMFVHLPVTTFEKIGSFLLGAIDSFCKLLSFKRGNQINSNHLYSYDLLKFIVLCFDIRHTLMYLLHISFVMKVWYTLSQLLCVHFSLLEIQPLAIVHGRIKGTHDWWVDSFVLLTKLSMVYDLTST